MNFKKTRQYIEDKRNSKSIFWKRIIFLKDKLRENIKSKYYWETIILEDYKTICFFIPKTASSSFRFTFYKLIKNKEPERFDDVYTLPKVMKKNLSKYNNYFKFTIMRNPYDKLVSCYYDFIIDKRRVGVIRDYPFYYGMSFERFVKVVCSTSDEKIDVHLKSQYTFITKDGKLIVDYIGKFERLDKEYNKIMKRMKVKNIPKLLHIKKSSKKKKGLYNKEIRARVKLRYKRDFEIYNKLK